MAIAILASSAGPSLASAAEIENVTFARKLGKQLEAVTPGDSFPPTATVYLSVKMKGQPQKGKLACEFFFHSQSIATATIDFAQQANGMWFNIGGITNVGFHLSHDDPLPVSQHFRAELTLNGKKVGSYPFKVVPPKSATKSRLIAAVLTKGVDDQFQPKQPTKRFLTDDVVHLAVRADVGLATWLEGRWSIDGKLDESSLASLTFQENATATGMAFSYLPEDGWPVGTHEVVLMLNDEEVSRQKFQITSTAPPNPNSKNKPTTSPSGGMTKTKPGSATEAAIPDDPQTAEEFNRRGEAYFEDERYQEALDDFDSAIKLAPKNSEYISNRGWAYYSLEDPDTALVEFEDAIALDSNNVYAYWGRAQLHLDNEDWAAATKDLSRAIRSADEDSLQAELYAERGRTKHQADQLQQALRDFDRAIAKNADYAWAHANRAEVLLDMGEQNAAIESLQKAVETDEENPEFHSLLGHAHERAEDFESAIEAFTGAILLDLGNASRYHDRARIHEARGDLSKAVKDLRKAIKADPENADSHNNLALLYFRQEEFEAAIAEMDIAIQLDPENTVLWYNRADIQWAAGNAEPAIRDLTHLLQHDPNDAYGWALRGQIYEATEQSEAAAADYSKAVDVAPDTFRIEHHRYLRVRNQTDEDLTLYLQYFADKWTPEDRTVAAVFTIPKGADLALEHNDASVRGSRFRIWAVGKQSQQEYDQYRTQDFVAVAEAGYATAEEDLDSITFRFPDDGDTSAATRSPSMNQTQTTESSLPPAQTEKLPRSRTINAVAYGSNDSGAFGICFPVEITVAKNVDHDIDAAFVLGQSGASWKAAGWMATCMAADMTGFDPLATQVRFGTQTSIDGPSAGGLMTAGTLAALRADPVRPDVAMTGTINPDGTIGPVSGIAQKMEGAAKAGMKEFLFPLGKRYDVDGNTKQLVDLFAHGKKLGLKVQAVGDVYSAYEALTGIRLPRPDAARAPALEPEMYERVRQMVAARLSQFRTNEGKLRGLPVRYRPAEVQQMIDKAKVNLPRIASLLQDGQAPVAFDDAINAAQASSVAYELARTLQTIDQRGVEAGKRFVRSFPTERLRVAAINAVKARPPKTLSGVSVMMQAYATLLQGIACQQISEELLSKELTFPMEGSQLEKDVVTVVQACVFAQIAITNYENMVEVLDVAGNVTGQNIPDGAPFVPTTLFLKNAAVANLNQFELVYVKGVADASKVDFDTMKKAMMQTDRRYLITRYSVDRSLPLLLKELEGNEAQVYAHLGSALQMYVMASRLQAEYYSLKVERNDEGDVTGVGSEAALKHMLDFSEDQAKRNIQLLRDQNVEPVSSIFFCQIGSGLRNRDREEQLGALTAFWQANVQARTLAYLGGFSDWEKAK